MLADGIDHLGMLAVFPLHVHSNQRVRGRHQKQDRKDQSEDDADHDQDDVEDRGKRSVVVRKFPVYFPLLREGNFRS